MNNLPPDPVGGRPLPRATPWLTGLLITVTVWGGLLWASLTPGGQALEQRLFEALLETHAPARIRAAHLLSAAGAPVTLVATALIWGALSPGRSLLARWTLPLLMICAMGMNLGLKAWFNRPRPEGPWGPLTQDALTGFPSGHATLALCAYGYLAWRRVRFGPEGSPWRRGQAAALWGLVLGVGWSRIALGAHNPWDVVAGFASGAPLLWAATRLDPADPAPPTESPKEDRPLRPL